jgi:predicted negative regulator of RcsB-dependent stress response
LGKVQRLSHKQIEAAIKRDELRDFLGGSGAWIKAHLENVLIGLVVLALLGFGGIYLLRNRAEDKVKAGIQLSAAEQLYSRALGSPDPQAIEQAKANYEQVRVGFEGSGEAENAELGLANLSFGQGKFDESKSAFERFSAEHPKSALEPLAVLGSAQSQEAMGKVKEAAAAYLSLGLRSPAHTLSVPALLEASRLSQALGDKASLKQAVEALGKLEAEGRVPENLKSRLASLKRLI